MKRKLLCIIMVLTLAFAEVSANANALTGETDKLIEKLSEFSSKDRENLITIVYPLVIVDDGIEILVDMIEKHDPDSDSLIDGLLSDVLRHTTKDKLVLMLRSIKIIPEDIRREYILAFIEREELQLSEENSVRLQEFIDIAYKKIPHLQKIMEEDGITNGTVAKSLTIIPAINGGMPVLKTDSQYGFSPYYISYELLSSWKAFCETTGTEGDIRQPLISLCEHFNETYSGKARMDVAKFFEELGICYITNEEHFAFKNVIAAGNEMFNYPVVYAYFSNGAMKYKTEMIMKNVSGIAFTDVDGWYKDCVTELAYMGIVSGRGNGVFCPDEYVTREEFVKMICAAINLPRIDAETPFVDVDNNAWYGGYIRTAYNYKVINGQSADTFGVGKNISRQDVAVICNNILKDFDADKVRDSSFKDADSIALYARDSVNRLAEIGIINGDDKGNFNPTSSITRAESAKIINELIYLIANTK